MGSWGAGALIGAGVIVLLLRAFLDASGTDAAPALLFVPLVGLLAWIAAARSAPGREGAVAWLDVSSGGRGTLLAEYELADERWRHASEEALTRVGRFPAAATRRLGTQGVPALGFALACLLVPMPEPEPAVSTAYFEGVADELREKLDALEEEVRLDEDTAAELEERLENLEAEISEGLPEAVFEALDQLESRLEQLALGAREAIETALDEARAAAERANEDPDGAASELSAALGKLAEAGLDESKLGELPEELRELMKNALASEAPSSLDPSQFSELGAELSELLDGKLQKLADAGLLDPSNLKKGQLAKLSEFKEHECDEDCKGGT
jgi:hypothetical protein